MALDTMSRLIGENPGWAALVLILLGSITVKKLELPVWSWAVAWINRRLDGLGQRLNASTNSQLSTLRADLDKHIHEADCREASRIRERILIFSAQLGRGWRHTEEMYVDILSDIDWYEEFCKNHPEYRNSRAVSAIAHVRADYQGRLPTHNFA